MPHFTTYTRAQTLKRSQHGAKLTRGHGVAHRAGHAPIQDERGCAALGEPRRWAAVTVPPTRFEPSDNRHPNIGVDPSVGERKIRAPKINLVVAFEPRQAHGSCVCVYFQGHFGTVP